MRMGKAKILFPFRGQMVSAYQIARAYGMQESVWSIKKRLLDGMSAEEAVEAVKNRLPIGKTNVVTKKKGTTPCTGIQPWEINRLRARLKPGDKLRVRVHYATFGQDKESIRVETCRVTGVYPHLVTLRRPCGLTTSKTYVELLMEGVVR